MIILFSFSSFTLASVQLQENSFKLEQDWSPDEVGATSSVAWGDVDGDGDLDLAVGSLPGHILIYLNVNGQLEFTASWTSDDENIYASSIAWGDVDGDGDLDLAVGAIQIQVYRNDNGQLESTASWVSDEEDGGGPSTAWGDVDGDGDLDLAVSYQDDPIRVYKNVNGQLESTASWASDEDGGSPSTAWGDVDGDGDLDLAVGTKVYKNVNGQLESTASWVSDDENIYASSIAWGDVDNDGDLDLATGNLGRNRVYMNENGQLESTASWTSDEIDTTWSLAWGDVDGDGDLDLAAGNEDDPIRVYKNVNGQLESTASWSHIGEDTLSLAWGDVDGDGDLDLAAGNHYVRNRVYVNQAGHLETEPSWTSGVDYTGGIAWGDVDGDGDLDLATSSASRYSGYSSQVYMNENGQLEPTASWVSDDEAGSNSIAWGDVDGDGDLDLAVGNTVYVNEDGQLESTASWASDENIYASSIAWGDVDGDGDLDLATSSASRYSGYSSQVYMNENGQLEPTASWASDEADETDSIAWGDVDNDGDLDLATGNLGRNRVYMNVNGQLESTASWVSDEADETDSIAWGDVDNDGDLDLAVGNNYVRNRVYMNENGQLESTASWASYETGDTVSIAWGDVDGDGDLDLAAGNGDDPIRVYMNVNGQLESTASWAAGGYLNYVAWGDVDGDGDLDLASANWYNIEVYLNEDGYESGISMLGVSRGDSYIFSDGIVPVQYRLYDPLSRPAEVQGYYSLNGGGLWLPATPTTTTITNGLTTKPFSLGSITDNAHTFEWEVLAEGFFGQSDNVVFRLEAQPSLKPQSNRIPGPFLFPRYASQTTPFRVRGFQVRTVSDLAGQPATPASNAIAFRLPPGQLKNAEPIGGLSEPSLTNAGGYLGGRDQFEEGEQLVALQPMTQTQIFDVYHTSASATEDGLAMQPVNMGRNVQELKISADNKLVLFHLDIALEWDARQETQFMATLEHDIRRASEILFDWTNGQVALGHIRIFHDAKNLPAIENVDNELQDGWQPWVDSHIRIFATNRMRPTAALGGITTQVVTDTVNADIIYLPGQIKIGSVWNRYGESSGALGEDWPRVLAHELGHYLLYLDDNYIGLDENGILTPVRTCPGAMADPYRDDYSEFHPQSGWEENCAQTLSQRELKRSDWETIGIHYPWLNIPNGSFDEMLAGPNILPLAVTQIESHSVDDLNFDLDEESIGVITVITGSVGLTETIDPPIWYLNESGAGTQAGADARAYLVQQEWLVDLGRPNLGEVIAHGAREGDKLCVFDSSTLRSGCEVLTNGDNQLALNRFPNWQPDIRVSPATTNTISIDVSNIPAGLELYARHYPRNGPANPAIALSFDETTYVGEFDLIHASAEGHINIWVNDDDPAQRREAIVNYALGGSPAFANARVEFPIGRGGFAVERGGFAVERGGFAVERGGFAVERGGFAVERGGFAVERGAPTISSNGQVVLISENTTFVPGEFYTLQSATTLPNAPAWASVVGNGYWISASTGAPDLTSNGEASSSVSFRYLGAEVPAGEESFLKIYFWGGQEWTVLPTQLDLEQNYASALTRGAGLYALMSSIDIPLYQAGWNLISYPVQANRPVTEALASIDGKYSIVYGHYPQEEPSEWRVYGVDVPAYVNSLEALEFGRGYWISTTEQITLSLKGGSEVSAASVSTSLTPPSTFYGEAQPTSDFVPAVGMPVQAFVNGVSCGQSETESFDGQIAYVVHVQADSGDGCGQRGQPVTIQIGDSERIIGEWSNDSLQEQAFAGFGSDSSSIMYLPLIIE